MANQKSLWFQGKRVFVTPKCDGRIEPTCPQSKRIADEYHRGFYTLTNVLNPTIRYDDYGAESPLKQQLRECKVGDTLWLVLVPPMHRVMDVFTYNDVTYTEHSGFDTMGGITLSLVTGKFTGADEDGNCPVADEKVQGTMVMPMSPDAAQQFVVSKLDELTDTNSWIGVGLRIEALPNNTTLADIVGRLVVGVHAIDYDAQMFM